MIYRSIVNDDLLPRFKTVLGRSLMNNAFNTCGIEQYLSMSSVIWPEFIELNGYIFISEFYHDNLDVLEQQFGKERVKIEKFVNSCSLADFFLLASDESVHDDVLIDQFGNILKFFWELRLKELFPDRKVVVELGMNIMGERGLTITIYQEAN